MFYLKRSAFVGDNLRTSVSDGLASQSPSTLKDICPIIKKGPNVKQRSFVGFFQLAQGNDIFYGAGFSKGFLRLRREQRRQILVQLKDVIMFINYF